MLPQDSEVGCASAEVGEVYAWGFPADRRLGTLLDAGSSQVGLRLQSLQSDVAPVWLCTLHCMGRRETLCCRIKCP